MLVKIYLISAFIVHASGVSWMYLTPSVSCVFTVLCQGYMCWRMNSVCMHTYVKFIFLEVSFCMWLFLGNSVKGSSVRYCASLFASSFFFKSIIS